MSKKQRKPVTLKDRLTPCIICLYPLSQKHHLLPFSKYGDLDWDATVQLCANCHDLYHLIEQHIYKESIQRDEVQQLFHVQTEQEKIIDAVMLRQRECSPLIPLAAHVALFEKSMSQENYQSDEERYKRNRHMLFIMGFKAYVDNERIKRDAAFDEIRNSGFFDTLFGGNVSVIEGDEENEHE